MGNRRKLNRVSFETMEAVSDSVDIGFNSEGDIMIKPEDEAVGNTIGPFGNYGSDSEEGSSLGDFNDSLSKDVATAGNIFGRVLEQQISKRMQSEPGDWELDPYGGAYLSQFIGEKLNQNTLSNIKNTVIKTLTYDGLIRNENLKVQVVPVTKEIINIIILVRRPNNGFLTHSFTFNVNEQARIKQF